MREIVPYIRKPKTPANLIEALGNGETIGLDQLQPGYGGYLSEVMQDGKVMGTIIYVPGVSADELGQ